MFMDMLQLFGIPKPEREYLFCHKRKFRMDYAWPNNGFFMEVEGGIWQQGRHNRAQGYLKDMEKYNLAAMLGWRMIRITPEELNKMSTISMIQKMIELEPAKIIQLDKQLSLEVSDEQ
jgi:very-short-patch-repair endonuclease